MNQEKSVKTSNRMSFLKKYGGIIFISVILILFILLALFNINFGQWLANTVIWFHGEFGDFGIYLGVFLISIFGNFTIIFPVPYTIALIVISAVIPGVNPVLLGIVGGLGASIGEVSAWLIGRGSKDFIGKSESMERMKGYVEKGWAPILIFIFAATPLPDDAFLIVLGIAQYSIFKALIYCFLGKFVLCFLCSALPIWLADTALGQFLFELFGIDLVAATEGIIPESTPLQILTSSLVWAACIIILFLLVYIDWSKLIKRLRDKIKTNSKDHKN
ncbi:MAG: YqaA family protein [Candidatus Hermodarchaeota archaeon]